MNSFYCNCTDEWTGALCEQPVNACELKPCKNNATCILGANKHDFTCACANGKVSPTMGALFTTLLLNNFTGFGGKFCEINIDDCASISCPPPKVCVDLINDYDCRCPPGFGGENCSIQLDPCARGPCVNGGTCLINSTSNDYFCACLEGFTGKISYLVTRT